MTCFKVLCRDKRFASTKSVGSLKLELPQSSRLRCFCETVWIQSCLKRNRLLHRVFGVALDLSKIPLVMPRSISLRDRNPAFVGEFPAVVWCPIDGHAPGPSASSCCRGCCQAHIKRIWSSWGSGTQVSPRKRWFAESQWKDLSNKKLLSHVTLVTPWPPRALLEELILTRQGMLWLGWPHVTSQRKEMKDEPVTQLAHGNTSWSFMIL